MRTMTELSLDLFTVSHAIEYLEETTYATELNSGSDVTFDEWHTNTSEAIGMLASGEAIIIGKIHEMIAAERIKNTIRLSQSRLKARGLK